MMKFASTKDKKPDEWESLFPTEDDHLFKDENSTIDRFSDF
jgi:hypothetical protein